MKVLAFVSTNEWHRDMIISFHGVTTNIDLIGRDALNGLTPFLVDINIPCGEEVFGTPAMSCPRCEWCDPESCDAVKYTRGAWSTGDIDNPPKVIQHRKYKIVVDERLSADSVIKVNDKEKGTVDMEAVLTVASKLSNEISVNSIVEI